MAELDKTIYDHSFDNNPSRLSSSIKDLWNCRKILFALAIRELKLSYAGTWLKALWIFIPPLINLGVFILVFILILGIRHSSQPSVLIFITGFLAWMPFISALNSAGNSLKSDSVLISKTQIPQLVFPAYRCFLSLPQIGVFLTLFLITTLYYNNSSYLTWKLLILPLIIAYQIIITFAISLIANILFSIKKDLHRLLFSLIGFGMWLTPVYYSLDMVPSKIRWIFYLNPLTSIVSLYRNVLLGSPLSFLEVIPGVSITVVLLYLGLKFFVKRQDYFIERV